MRPAPLQVIYLGYPGTCGLDCLDYLIADHYVIPPEQRRFYSESIVYLPDCYQVNDSRRPRPVNAPERTAFGLPAKGFVFACFNQSYKITPEMFDIWMRLLTQVPGSVLWLYRSNSYAPEYLSRASLERGVSPERLVFATTLPHGAHLERLALADLCLDTLPVNSHTTASDALWAGVPLVTCSGAAFTARVAGSILTAMGLPELITHSLSEYESVALHWATHRELLQSLRQRLARQRDSSALFDCKRFTRHLEDAYRHMWARFERGEEASDIIVARASDW